MDPLLEATGLRVGYRDLTVIWDVTLRLVPGRTTALVGRNGAGKTTLLSGLAGLLPLRAGRLMLDGEDVTKRSAWERTARGLGIVQEGKRIFRSLTVQENLTVGMPKGVRGRQATSRIEEVYQRFPVLAERSGAIAGTLSGGQQQMLALGSTLIGRPRVLLVDEPSSGLAPVIVDELFAAIDELKREGIAVLLVEQLVEEVLSGYADDVLVLDSGHIILADAVDNVSVDDVVRGVYAG